MRILSIICGLAIILTLTGCASQQSVPAIKIQEVVNTSQKSALKWQPDAYLRRLLIRFPIKDQAPMVPFEFDYFSNKNQDQFTALVDMAGKIYYSAGSVDFGDAYPIISGEWRIDIQEAIALLIQQNSDITWPAERRSWLLLERREAGAPLTWCFYEIAYGSKQWEMQLKYTIDAVTGQVTPATGAPVYR
jgi:hypothetical protein